ncbi:hypothetical protein BP6252_13896 [Coleophoma cylindrospora]|uniref:Cytochrome P450 52A12 n=1 Tax=Coleophoma cylindrospora TaxID=1849047 RepID=A0A3D8Q6J1_9HELO|nr:hypothetical protein BP6252_13896 [Coleophoma cylindrospora]
MFSILYLTLLFIASLVLYKFVPYVITRYQNAALAKKLGAERVPTLTSSDPLGIGFIVRIIKSNNVGKLLEHLHERLQILSKQEGRPVLTYQTHLFQNWFFVTSDPKNIQALLATQFKDFCLGPIRYGTFSVLLGHGIFSADGPQWEHSRALLRPQFARDQVSDLDLEERHLQNMLLALPVESDGWTKTIDLLPIYFRLTIDSSSEFLFGDSVNSQLSALPGRSTPEKDLGFVSAFERSQDLIANAFRFNDWYAIGLTKELRDACKVCHEYIDPYVLKALSQNKEKSSKKGEEKQHYIFLEELARQTQDPVEIRDQLLSILVAGRDTTASLLSFLWLLLSQHPDVFDKLRSTVINEFGTYQNPRDITFSSLKSCSYLQWCMNETLRLFPTVPLNGRRSLRDTTLPRGGGPDGLSPIFIPKDTEINYSVYSMHRSKELWGEDANDFIPGRWHGRKSGFEYLPFNGGPRICLGQQFALTEAGYITVRLLQRFDKLDGSAMKGLDYDWNLALTGRPRYGVKLRFHAADED